MYYTDTFTMKNIITLFIVTLLFMLTILFSVISNAQVGIGMTNPQALLDIQPNTTKTTYAKGNRRKPPNYTLAFIYNS